jgi:hypothetical protein
LWLAVLASLLQTTIALVRPSDTETPGIANPLGIGALTMLDRILDVAGEAPWLAVGVLSAASLVVRFRRARAEERQQIKWVVYVLVLLVSYTLIDQYLLEDHIPLFLRISSSSWSPSKECGSPSRSPSCATGSTT